MRRSLILFLISLSSASVLTAQEISAIPKEDIINTGRKLYCFEKAYLVANEIMLKQYPGKYYRIGGWVSYRVQDSVRTIFWLKKDSTSIDLTITFDSFPDTMNYVADPKKRTATEEELRLINLHQEALQTMFKNKGKFFSFYNYTSNHLLLFPGETEDQVYVLTISNDKEDLIFGNDYLLVFAKNGKLKSKTKIHEHGYSIDLKQDISKDSSAVETFHEHKGKTPRYITATDICTLLIYNDKINWDKHTVLSPDFACTWNIKKQELQVLIRKSWDKIQEKKMMARKKKSKIME